MNVVNLADAKAHLSDLVDRVEAEVGPLSVLPTCHPVNAPDTTGPLVDSRGTITETWGTTWITAGARLVFTAAFTVETGAATLLTPGSFEGSSIQMMPT